MKKITDREVVQQLLAAGAVLCLDDTGTIFQRIKKYTEYAGHVEIETENSHFTATYSVLRKRLKACEETKECRICKKHFAEHLLRNPMLLRAGVNESTVFVSVSVYVPVNGIACTTRETHICYLCMEQIVTSVLKRQ